MKLTPKEKEKIIETKKTQGVIKALKEYSSLSPEHENYIKREIEKLPQKVSSKDLYNLYEKILQQPLKIEKVTDYLVYTIKDIPKIYMQEIEESRQQMKGLADTKLPKAMERITGLLRYISSPITAVSKAFIGRPITESMLQIGASPQTAEIAGLIGEVALPVAGQVKAASVISKMPGITKDVKILGKTISTTPVEYKQLEKEFAEITKLTSAVKGIQDTLNKYGISLSEVAYKVKAMTKLNQEQKAIIKAQRAAKFADFDEALKYVTQKEKFDLRDLKETFDTLAGVYESIRTTHPYLKDALFSMDDVYKLAQYIADDTVRLSIGDKISATKALIKSVSGELPYQSEVNSLAKAFGKEFAKIIEQYALQLNKNSELKGFAKVVFEASNLPRTIMASCDISGILRQGIFFVRRKEFWKNIPVYIRSMFSKDYDHVMLSIINDAYYPVAKRYRLQITEVGKFSQSEEMFMSTLAKKIPIFGKAIQMSEQGYVAFLNKLRFDIFRNSYIYLKDKLPSSELDDAMIKLTRYINNATGRGETLFGVPLQNELAYVASNVFFAPRLIAGRINTIGNLMQAITGVGGIHPEVRKMILKDSLGFVGFVSTVLGLGVLSGADIKLNPTSSDFLKLRYGDVRIDLLGGFQQYFVLLSRLISETYTSSSTDITRQLNSAFNSQSSIDVVIRFASMKTAPIVSFAIDLATGRDFTGKNLDLAVAIGSRLLPMYVNDMVDIIENKTPLPITVTAGLMSVVGAGLAVYGANDHYKDYFKNIDIKKEVDRKMFIMGRHLQYFDSFKTFNGAPLKDSQAEMFMKRYAEVVYPILYKYLKTIPDNLLGSSFVEKQVESIMEKSKKYAGYELFGIPKDYAKNIARISKEIVVRKLAKEGIPAQKIRVLAEKETQKVLNDIIQEHINTYNELKLWVKNQ